MIKPQWITRRNGFETGGLCLYLDPTLMMSFVFRLMKMDVRVVKRADGGLPQQLWVEVHAENGHYGTQMYLDPRGDFYPMESRQYHLWSPSNREAAFYPVAGFGSSSLGRMGQVYDDEDSSESPRRPYQMAMYGESEADLRHALGEDAEIVERPDWIEAR